MMFVYDFHANDKQNQAAITRSCLPVLYYSYYHLVATQQDPMKNMTNLTHPILCLIMLHCDQLICYEIDRRRAR